MERNTCKIPSRVFGGFPITKNSMKILWKSLWKNLGRIPEDFRTSQKSQEKY